MVVITLVWSSASQRLKCTRLTWGCGSRANSDLIDVGWGLRVCVSTCFRVMLMPLTMDHPLSSADLECGFPYCPITRIIWSTCEKCIAPGTAPSCWIKISRGEARKANCLSGLQVTQLISWVGIPGLDGPQNPTLGLSNTVDIQEQLQIFKIQVLASFIVLFQLIYAIYA